MKSEFKKIAIICASERELAPFLPLIENPTISERAMLRIHEGRLNGFEVAAVYCGVCGAKIESEAPVQSVQTESFVTPENENEEVVCTPVQAENIATQPVALTAEKTETSGDLPSSKHQNKRGVFDKNKALSIAKSAIILVFCIIMMAM